MFEWEREHPRAALGVAAIATVGSLVGAHTVHNVKRLHDQEEAPYQRKTNLSAYQPVMENVVNGDPVEVRTYHVHFGSDVSYDGDAFCSTVAAALESLDGVDIEPYWEEIAVTPETWEAYADQADRSQDVLHRVERDITCRDLDRHEETVIAAVEDVLEHYGVNVAEDSLLGIVSPFKADIGGRCYGNASLMKQTQPQKVLENTAVHEYAHSFGIDHAYNPFDIMSYSELQDALSQHVTMPFTPESKYRWNVEKTAAERLHG